MSVLMCSTAILEGLGGFAADLLSARVYRSTYLRF